MSDLPSPGRTALRAVAAVIVRHLLTAAGTYLAHRGWVDQATADSAVGPIADELLGAGLVIGSAGWGVVRAKLSHGRFARAWAILTAASPDPRPPAPDADSAR